MIDVDIRNKMDECRAKGRDATEEDFDLKINDNEFLKRLQKCVDLWYSFKKLIFGFHLRDHSTISKSNRQRKKYN
jgi:hypothetical protein